MNAERLHKILLDLNNDLAETKVLSLLTAVSGNLQNIVNEPTGGAHQTKLVQSLNALYSSLINSKYNLYTPSWRASIEEISHGMEFGNELKVKIENILSTNTITPAQANTDIKAILEEFKEFQNAVKDLLNGFALLSIGTESLEQGECELGYTIPRELIKNKLSSFVDEIEELKFILDHFSEAVTGKKEEFDIKTISSSDFVLYVILALTVADALSKALERILNHYKQILEIKELKNKLNERGISQEDTKPIEDHVNNSMTEEIKKIAKDVVESHNHEDKGRKNELENGVVISLNKLANRIDNGFRVEIRVEPLPSPKKNEEVTEEEQKERELQLTIQERSKKIEYLETGGKNILQLPEGDKTD